MKNSGVALIALLLGIVKGNRDCDLSVVDAVKSERTRLLHTGACEWTTHLSYGDVLVMRLNKTQDGIAGQVVLTLYGARRTIDESSFGYPIFITKSATRIEYIDSGSNSAPVEITYRKMKQSSDVRTDSQGKYLLTGYDRKALFFPFLHISIKMYIWPTAIINMRINLPPMTKFTVSDYPEEFKVGPKQSVSEHEVSFRRHTTIELYNEDFKPIEVKAIGCVEYEYIQYFDR